MTVALAMTRPIMMRAEVTKEGGGSGGVCDASRGRTLAKTMLVILDMSRRVDERIQALLTNRHAGMTSCWHAPRPIWGTRPRGTR